MRSVPALSRVRIASSNARHVVQYKSHHNQAHKCSLTNPRYHHVLAAFSEVMNFHRPFVLAWHYHFCTRLLCMSAFVLVQSGHFGGDVEMEATWLPPSLGHGNECVALIVGAPQIPYDLSFTSVLLLAPFLTTRVWKSVEGDCCVAGDGKYVLKIFWNLEPYFRWLVGSTSILKLWS